MKRYYFLLLAVLALLCSCNKHNPEPAPVPEPDQIVFDLSAIHPGEGLPSKAKKTNWENGDVIFVFFTGVESPKYLKMSLNGSSWTSTEMEGDKAGSLGLKNNDKGKMTAVYLPFGNDVTVSKGDNGSFVFSDTYYAYYLTGTLEYEVTANKVSGAFQMYIPEGFVQFFIADAAAADGEYQLATDAVVPTALASVAADGTITETTTTAGAYLTGYAYKQGYLFSAKLNGDYAYKKNYYFDKRKVSDKSREDYFVHVESPLADHAAINLPSNGDNKWIPVGSGKTVKLTKGSDNYGTWQTCNDGETRPEAKWTQEGDIMRNFSEITNTAKLPSKARLDSIVTDLSWHAVSVHNKSGLVVKADTGFMFLPVNKSTKQGYYWSKTESTNNHVWYLYISISANNSECLIQDEHDKGYVNYVRYMQ